MGNALLSASSSSSGIDMSGHVNFQDACSICLEQFNNVTIAKCEHEYHLHCIHKCSKNKEPAQETSPLNSTNSDTNSGPPTVLLNHRIDRFRIMSPIGKSSNGNIQVCKAAFDFATSENFPTQDAFAPVGDGRFSNASPQIQDNFVAVKYVIDDGGDTYQNLKVAVDISLSMPYHPNIIGIRNSPFRYQGYYYVLIPLMEPGSLRSIMAARFPNGLPEECIVVALKETLNALSLIHAKGYVHGEINAGHIFFNVSPAEIKLAFSASIYDEDQEQNQPYSSSSSSLYLPMGSICEWAAAPEVYEHGNRAIGRESDIWMIGITALELAYGGLRVLDREDLDSKLRTIQIKMELPGGWRDNYEYGIKMLTSFLFKKRNFSKAFQNMVVSCLARNPQWRPNVQNLLRYDVFVKCKSDVHNFHNLLRRKN